MPAAPEGAHEHDGVYLRMALGAGYLGAKFGSDYSVDYGGKVDGTLGGGSGALELALGGTVAKGLVLGGGVYLDGRSKTRTHGLQINGQDAAVDSVSLGIVGLFGDYYFDPTSGWHVQGTLGAAWIDVGKARSGEVVNRENSLSGVGLCLGGGYEWWIANQWSMGVLLRGIVVAAANNAHPDDRWSYEAFALPELLLSVTFQ
jgi:hypothetical protein